MHCDEAAKKGILCGLVSARANGNISKDVSFFYDLLKKQLKQSLSI